MHKLPTLFVISGKVSYHSHQPGTLLVVQKPREKPCSVCARPVSEVTVAFSHILIFFFISPISSTHFLTRVLAYIFFRRNPLTTRVSCVGSLSHLFSGSL